MRALKLFTCVCLVAGGLAVAAGDASAKHTAKHHAVQSPSVDCNAHNYKLTHHYSVPALQHALVTMPAQIKEYTPCYQVVQEQLNAQLSASGNGSKVTPKSSGSSLSGVLIAVIVVIVLAGGGMAYWASRRNAGGGDEQPPTTDS